MGYQINQTASEGNNSQHPPVRRIDRRDQNGKIDCSQASVAIAQTDGAVVLAVTGVDVVELASRLLNSGMLDGAVSPIDKRVQAGLAADGCQVKVEAVVLAQTEKPIVVQPETDIAGSDVAARADAHGIAEVGALFLVTGAGSESRQRSVQRYYERPFAESVGEGGAGQTVVDEQFDLGVQWAGTAYGN